MFDMYIEMSVKIDHMQVMHDFTCVSKISF